MSATAKPIIMVVDDSHTILRAAKLFLEPNYEVFAAPNGYNALAAVAEVKPDLVLMDVMMPLIDGYVACMAIKANPQYANVPVVMLSSKDSPFDKAKAEMMGCDGYLTKPFMKQALLEEVKVQLERLEARQNTASE